MLDLRRGDLREGKIYMAFSVFLLIWVLSLNLLATLSPSSGMLQVLSEMKRGMYVDVGIRRSCRCMEGESDVKETDVTVMFVET